MNDWQAKQQQRALRAELLAIVEAQKGVIGAIARGLTSAQKDIEDLKLALAECERTPR